MSDTGAQRLQLARLNAILSIVSPVAPTHRVLPASPPLSVPEFCVCKGVWWARLRNKQRNAVSTVVKLDSWAGVHLPRW
jgi:hypothetical protein